MKIKYLFIAIISLLLIISISQVISIPPYSGDIFKVYKSGYFDELDRGFEIIKDSFINIKTLGKVEYGWIFLEDIEKTHNIKIQVFNKSGYEVFAPGDAAGIKNNKILKLYNSQNPEISSEISMGEYKSIIPVLVEDKCKFCHTKNRQNGIVGFLQFKRKYDAHIYYSAERIIIFLIISIILCGLLFFLFKWEPEKNIKEMFDNL